MISKFCNSCNKSKLISEFHKDNNAKDFLKNQCKTCRNHNLKIWKRNKWETDKEWRAKYIESNCRRAKEKYNEDKDFYAKKFLKRRYGITLEEYNKILIEQDYKCKICNNPETQIREGKLKRMHVDHCHKSGKVRGLLCSECNTGLGKFKDNVNFLSNAIEYLNNSFILGGKK